MAGEMGRVNAGEVCSPGLLYCPTNDPDAEELYTVFYSAFRREAANQEPKGVTNVYGGEGWLGLLEDRTVIVEDRFGPWRRIIFSKVAMDWKAFIPSATPVGQSTPYTKDVTINGAVYSVGIMAVPAHTFQVAAPERFKELTYIFFRHTFICHKDIESCFLQTSNPC